jgi:hypothetical protein
MKLDGSYTKTCRNCYDYEPGCFAGPCDSLQAECETSNKQWTQSTLRDVSKCKPGTIWNDNGQLKCSR